MERCLPSGKYTTPTEDTEPIDRRSAPAIARSATPRPSWLLNHGEGPGAGRGARRVRHGDRAALGALPVSRQIIATAARGASPPRMCFGVPKGGTINACTQAV